MYDIKMPLPDWPHEDLEDICDLIQSGSRHLGFVFRDSLYNRIKLNKEGGTIWAAYLQATGELVGAAASHPKRNYPAYIASHGIVMVPKESRRRRVGTSLYAAQVMQAMLDGRRDIEDQIVPHLSPYMGGPTDCGEGFLPSLNYKHVGTLPRRTSGFNDLQIWIKSISEFFEDYLPRLPKGVQFYLLDTAKNLENFNKNVYNYHLHDPLLAKTTWALRNYVLTGEIKGNTLGEVGGGN